MKFVLAFVAGVLICVIAPALGVKTINPFNDQWTETPEVLHFKVSFFEIQNPYEVHYGEATPIVREKGPYVYRITKWKTNIQFSEDNQTVSFDVYRQYDFDQEASGELTDTDEIHILNPVMNSILQMAEMDEATKYLLPILEGIIPRVFNDATDFFLKTTPRAVLFDGIEFCLNPTGLAPLFCNTVRDTPSKNIIEIPNGLSFALFRDRNNALEGSYVVNSGLFDPALTNQIEQFNGADRLEVWRDGICNTIIGSFGQLFPPSSPTEEPLKLFQSDICRVVNVHYEGPADVGGVSGLLYKTSRDLLQDIGPEFGNECFCVDETFGVGQTQDNGCLFSGALDLFTCINGPMIMTKPHMLDTDELYTTVISGQEPDSEKHDTTMFLDPQTGQLLQGFKRIQLNSFLRPIYRVRLSEKYLPVLMPLLWIDEGIEIEASSMAK